MKNMTARQKHDSHRYMTVPMTVLHVYCNRHSVSILVTPPPPTSLENLHITREKSCPYESSLTTLSYQIDSFLQLFYQFIRVVTTEI